MKTREEYYGLIKGSERERFFECKSRAQAFFDEKNFERTSKGVTRDCYQFSYIYLDHEKGQMQGPIPFNVELEKREYISLLTLQLFDKEGLTYNRILFIVPDVIRKIDTQIESIFLKQGSSVGCQPYVVVFNEVIEDAKKIEETMPAFSESSSQELKPYKFKIWIDGNYYDEDDEIEEEILLTDEDVETIKRLVREYDSDLSCGLMPILKEGDERLYNRFYSIIFPPVFYELFQRDDMFEPNPGDEGEDWEEDDVLYLMETYGDGYDFEDAYICYVPDKMKPSKPQVSKSMNDNNLHKYIKKWFADTQESIFNDICFSGKHSISNVLHDDLNDIIHNKLFSYLKRMIQENDEGIIVKPDYNPFTEETKDEIAVEAFDELKERHGTMFIFD